MKRIELNLETGEQTIVELDEAEIAYANAQKKIWLDEQAKQSLIAETKQSALNKLMALGLTEKEALALSSNI